MKSARDLNLMAIEQARTRDLVESETRHSGQTPVFTGGAMRVLVKSIAANYLVCRAFDGTTEGTTDIYVARPRKLRHGTTYHPQASAFVTVDAQTATVTVSGTAYTCHVTEAYVVDEELYAIPESTGLTDPGGKDIVLVDDNRNARAWTSET